MAVDLNVSVEEDLERQTKEILGVDGKEK